MKLHPLTAVRNAGAYAAQGASFGVAAGIVGTATDLLPGSAVVALTALGMVVGAAIGVARFAVFEYELGERTLSIRSGILQRQEREIPLERVQNVDVEQSAIQRLLGLAVVRFETAGGGQTEGQLRFVAESEAASLQSELRRRKRTARGEAGDATPAESEPEVLFELSPRGLALLAAVSFKWGVIPLLAILGPMLDDLLLSVFRQVVAPLVLDGEPSLANPRLLGVLLAGGALYLLATWVISAAITVVQYHGFRLARVDDELVYERGLLRRYSGTVPLDKVQSLAVEANVPMRRLGYAALRIETAGYAAGGGGDGASAAPSAVPLAPREAVLSLASALEGVEDLDVERPPRRARRRYVGRYALAALALAAAMAAVHALVLPLGLLWAVPVLALAAAVPGGHLRWANRGHRTDDTHFVARTGVWRRATRVVPYYRLQTVITERTVFQRRLRLASVVGDTAATSGLLSGHATAHDLDRDDAAALHTTLRERLQADLRRRAAAGDAAGAGGGNGDGPDGGDAAGGQAGEGAAATGAGDDEESRGRAGEPSSGTADAGADGRSERTPDDEEGTGSASNGDPEAGPSGGERGGGDPEDG